MEQIFKKILRPDGREEVVVVGGGISGVLSALMLNRATDESGKPLYHVTLLEEGKQLFSGASIIASRLHLGGEYPLSPKTAIDCLYAAVLWKLCMPDGIYTEKKKMAIAVSAGSAAKGELTVDMYKQHYTHLREHYAGLFDTVHTIKLAEMKKRRRKWTREDTGKMLFGLPEEGTFFSILEKDAFNKYDGEQAGKFVASNAGGFQTQEPGINPPLLFSALEEELKRQQEKGNITIACKSKVERIDALPEGGYSVSTADGKTVSASQVVQAAYNKNSEILHTSGVEAPAINALHQAILVIDLGPGSAKDIEAIFRLIGPDHGGMLSPYDDRFVIAYQPGAAYFGGEKALAGADVSIPAGWKLDKAGKNIHRERIWKQKYWDELRRVFPVLEKYKIDIDKHITIHHPINLNKDSDRKDRRYCQITQPRPGHMVINATKLTYGPLCAHEAVRTAMSNSLGKEISITRHGILRAALRKEHSLADIPVERGKAARDFAEKHGFSRDIIPPEISPRERILRGKNNNDKSLQRN